MLKKTGFRLLAVIIAIIMTTSLLLPGCDKPTPENTLPVASVPSDNNQESDIEVVPESTSQTDTIIEVPHGPVLEELVEPYREEHIAYTDAAGNCYDVTFSLMRFLVDSPAAERCNEEIARYNAPMEYAQLVLSGEMERYLSGTTLHGLED